MSLVTHRCGSAVAAGLTRRFLRALGSWCAVAGLLLAGCGGSGVEGPPKIPESVAPQAPRQMLAEFLYGHSTAQVRYWASWDRVPPQYAHLVDRMAGLPTRETGVTTGLFSIGYANANLPQLSVHIRRAGNSRLLVYNHGHGGLPAATEAFASEFLSRALTSGFDLLITSLPLVGLNAAPPESPEPLFILTRDYPEPVAVDPQLLGGWTAHALYELIDDADHYLHFFIDGAVIPSAIATGRAPAWATAPRVAEDLPYTGPRYATVDYVGLSGGATSGLPACAVQAFDHCILVAGVMPDHLRISDYSNFGDAEQQTRSFYERFSVPDLMAIVAGGATRLTLMYNRRDPCCFADPAASRFQAEFPGYDIRVTDLAIHGYVPDDVLALLHQP